MMPGENIYAIYIVYGRYEFALRETIMENKLCRLTTLLYLLAPSILFIIQFSHSYISMFPLNNGVQISSSCFGSIPCVQLFKVDVYNMDDRVV